MAVNPGAVLLLDEPDAHLEILRQRQIYQVLTEQAAETGSQIIAASHSEIILNEAADRDMVIAFVGKPHRIDDRGSQVLKALREIGFEHYYLAEETGWVLYLEGSTDLAMLRAFAIALDHPAREYLERPFVHYVGNQPRKAQDHFHALREAKPDLVGIAIYDRLETNLPDDSRLVQRMWKRRELENYLCQRETLLAFAESRGRKQQGELFGQTWRQTMEESIGQIESALQTLGKDPWGPDIKASDEFLAPLFKRFYNQLEMPNLMNKTDYHVLAAFVPADKINPRDQTSARRHRGCGQTCQTARRCMMGTTTIDRLIINSPYEEPARYWRYDHETRTFDLLAGRRPAGYVVATPGSKSFDDPGIFVEIPLVNQNPPARQRRGGRLAIRA